MKIKSKDFRVPEGDKVNLKKWPTLVKPVYQSKERGSRRRQGNARLIVSRIILDTFKALKMRCPETDEKRRQGLLTIRQQLMEK